jgi:hypothetical protein
LASTDWRHLGRLAGFTNQKPRRRTSGGYAPWVKILHARAGLAPAADLLLQSLQALVPPPLPCAEMDTALRASAPTVLRERLPTPVAAAQANRIYQHCMQRWRIRERFPQPDWSIVDLWVSRHLLSQGTSLPRVYDILRLGSPHFPRCHGDPEDYLHRTIDRARFPRCAPLRAVCTLHA